DDEIKHSVVNTTLAGKGHSSMQEIIAKLSLEAVQIVAESDSSVDISKIKLISQTGGKVEDSRVFRGLMLPKKRISSDMKREVYEGKILLVDGGLEKNNVSTDLKLNVTTVGIIESFRQEERKMLKQMVDRLVDNNISVLACRESIDDDIKNYLTEQGIQAFRRVSRNDLNMLAKTCNASIVNSIMGIGAKNIGEFASSKNITIDGKDFWIVEGDGNAATIVAKASTVDVVGEVERCFDDSLGVSTQLIEDGKVVCGGGAAYVALAKRLRRFAETIPGREQLAIEAYADAIEVIVRVLAENAGIDPISALLDVVAEQTNANSDNIGLNLTNGKPGNMIELGVLEPQGIIKQAIIGATEVAISILRIDDVLWAKQEMEMPELPDEEL
ncbi:MAG: TCP-1/cpn60 chaperonin family protein, partial [Candidatus Thermoplasmatota archaeon]|nr:TCP-1/cpn60 chaperonin family protein [Candidatus Thermoplasmatota archaeon]